jgi:MFS family permease
MTTTNVNTDTNGNVTTTYDPNQQKLGFGWIIIAVIFLFLLGSFVGGPIVMVFGFSLIMIISIIMGIVGFPWIMFGLMIVGIILSIIAVIVFAMLTNNNYDFSKFQPITSFPQN